MEFTRRSLMMGALGAARMAGAPAYDAKLAVQVFVWTQYLRKENRSLADGVEEVIRGCRTAGFEHAEFMSNFFTPELRDNTISLLREHSLGVPVCYHGGTMHTEPGAAKTIQETLELAKALRPVGTKIINTNPTPKPNKALKTDAELAIQAKALNDLDAALRTEDYELIVHHHDPEMMQNAREWRHILRNTKLNLCIDLMWVARGGQDPLAILKEAGSRVATLHVRNMRGGVCTEAAGDGEIDYPAIVGHLKRTGWRGWAIVELFHEPDTTVTRPLVENLRRSREYVAKVFSV